MAKKDGSISILTLRKLTTLVPLDTQIYFKSGDGNTYSPACEEEITWSVQERKVFLNPGEDDESPN